MTILHLATIWNTDTVQGHSLTVVHRDIPLADEDECRRKEPFVGRMSLASDGTLMRHHPDGTTSIVDPADVTIHVYTRPFEQRGTPFIPDMTSETGRARMRAAMCDPRYKSVEGEHVFVDISLEELAGIPGATGMLASIAIDVTKDHHPTGHIITVGMD